jgi:hypothetical protein
MEKNRSLILDLIKIPVLKMEYMRRISFKILPQRCAEATGLNMNAKRHFTAGLMLIFMMLIIFSCKEKKAFVDPVYVFMKWSEAVKNLNYKEYSECEAFPKDDIVFRELYGDFYFADLIIRELGEYNQNDIKIDSTGYKYNLRKVYFECKRIERKSAKAVQEMKGDVEFVNFINGPNINRGWLMYNRTIISTGMKIKK